MAIAKNDRIASESIFIFQLIGTIFMLGRFDWIQSNLVMVWNQQHKNKDTDAHRKSF